MLCALFLTLTFAAGTVLWIAAEFFTCVVWIIAGKEEEIRLLLQKQVSKASIAKIVDVRGPPFTALWGCTPKPSKNSVRQFAITFLGSNRIESII